ncbi:Trypsin-like protease precursor [Vibrio aerogenes CECT 7868]|uniref:Trypsin-like protease n=1 Tax=Vibrio aerogenes CECT 7868 TaxID=1216006 RepID=A0A1M5YTA9_9VIBR|nr:serine protease [Vibrio aerogenes]SHI15357.1 Trypsin-like protease precursor [Vibrio aerogenes CECT 7868]
MKSSLSNIASVSVALCVSLASISVHAASADSSRIINGTESVKGDWPFMTAIITKGKTASRGQFCGGSFIGGRYVLTASHCVNHRSPDDIEVSVGIHDLSNEDTEGQRVGVQAIYMHEDYDAELTDNDIAIIELDQAITATSIPLASNTLVDSLETSNPDLTVMGWGNLSTTSTVYPNVLYQVDVPYVDRSTCQNIGGDYSTVGEDAICAGYAEGGKDSCQGDSGGPLLYNDNGTYKQVGIVSWGDGCAQPNAYGVYTNVGYFNQGWIAQHTDGVSYTQNKYFINSDEEQYTLQFPVRNYSTESFDITNITLPAGFTLTENTCTSTLAENDSCQLTVQVDVATATASPSYSSSTSATSNGTTVTTETKRSTISVTTDHSQSPELEMNTSFITTSSSAATTTTTSSKSSGGASLGLGLFAVFAFISRRRKVSRYA